MFGDFLNKGKHGQFDFFYNSKTPVNTGAKDYCHKGWMFMCSPELSTNN